MSSLTPTHVTCSEGCNDLAIYDEDDFTSPSYPSPPLSSPTLVDPRDEYLSFCEYKSTRKIFTPAANVYMCIHVYTCIHVTCYLVTCDQDRTPPCSSVPSLLSGREGTEEQRGTGEPRRTDTRHQTLFRSLTGAVVACHPQHGTDLG